MKKVLIIGHKGFIGGNLQKATGWEGVDSTSCDIRNPGAVESCLAFHNPDIVVLLAGKAGVAPSLEDEPGYVETNITGTHNVVVECWRRGIRLIFASSSSVYHASSPYARTKQGAEKIINAYMTHGLDALILRFFTVFGEHNRPDMAAYKFTQSIYEGSPIELYGDCWRDFTYVQDLCRLIEKASLSKVQGTYDAGFGDSVPVHYLVSSLEQVMGVRAKVQVAESRAFDAPRTKADPYLTNYFSIKKTDFRQALRNMVEDLVPRLADPYSGI